MSFLPEHIKERNILSTFDAGRERYAPEWCRSGNHQRRL